MSPADLGKALVAGGIPSAIVALANYETHIDIPPLTAWDAATITALKYLLTFAGGGVSYYALKGHPRRNVLRTAVLATVLCVVSWYFYMVYSALPQSKGSVLTWNWALFGLYVFGFAQFAIAFGAICRLPVRRGGKQRS